MMMNIMKELDCFSIKHCTNRKSIQTIEYTVNCHMNEYMTFFFI